MGLTKHLHPSPSPLGPKLPGLWTHRRPRGPNGCASSSADRLGRAFFGRPFRMFRGRFGINFRSIPSGYDEHSELENPPIFNG